MRTERFDLARRVAVVIGGSGTLGGATCEGLARAGTVIAVLRRGNGTVSRRLNLDLGGIVSTDRADHMPSAWTVHTFHADVTIPIVFVSVDWCEIRNESYDAWRAELAAVAGTDPERVLVTTIHQHDAPVVDIQAQRLLEARNATGAVCDIAFATSSVRPAAVALATALEGPGRRVTHVGIGQAMVERVASNRRYVRPDGSISYDRTSASQDPEAHAAPEGTIDPWLRTLSFRDDDQGLLALSSYAVHPMSYYGNGEVSADFVGIARRARQQALPDVLQVYASGCSGNVTAGKYNDGARSNRPVLAARIETAMAAAWAGTERQPLESASFRSSSLGRPSSSCCPARPTSSTSCSPSNSGPMPS